MEVVTLFDFTGMTISDLRDSFRKFLNENASKQKISIQIQNISRDVLRPIICMYSLSYSCSLSPLVDAKGKPIVNAEGTPIGYTAEFSKRN